MTQLDILKMKYHKGIADIPLILIFQKRTNKDQFCVVHIAKKRRSEAEYFSHDALRTIRDEESDIIQQIQYSKSEQKKL